MKTKRAVFKVTPIVCAILPQHLLASVADIALQASPGLEEVVVTASRRAVGVQDLPMSVSALAGDTLDKQAVMGMDEYTRSIPSINVQSRGAGLTTLVFRGVAADPQNEVSTVGIYFGEVPVTGLGSWFGGSPDLKMVDIERVEALRGPQGTFYGSGSMGGTLRIIPKAPDFDGVSGNLSVRYSQTSKSSDANDMVQGTINLPVIDDRLAVRATAYRYDNAGYIDNVAGSDPVFIAESQAVNGIAPYQTDTAGDTYEGGRVTALFTPTDNLTVSASYITQKIEQDGVPSVNLRLSEYQQARSVGALGSEFLENDIDIFNAVIEYQFEYGTLTSSSSWMDQNHVSDARFSSSPAWGLYSDNVNDAFVQELRFTSLLNGPFQFVAGAYYQETETELNQLLLWNGLGVNPYGGEALFDGATRDEETQEAVFTELSYDITSRVTATLGARLFKYDVANRSTGEGVFLGGSLIDDRISAKTDGENYKANLTYSLNDDLLVYAQWAEGYRNGKPHPVLPPATCDADSDGLIDGPEIPFPDQIAPDSLDSYELGAKWASADSRAKVNGALFYIDWSGIPVQQSTDCGFPLTVNAGEATSQGLELEGEYLITDSLRFNFSLSVINAELGKDDQSLNARKGDYLPGVSRLSGSSGLEYRFAAFGYDAFSRIDYSYTGPYDNTLSPAASSGGDYGLVDLAFGISLNSITFDLFVKNLLDEDAVTWVDTDAVGEAYRVRPRTVGVTARYSF